ncbi:MAG: glycosyltransferase family 2 protein [Candidatus Eremiobacteraeota bacterium]|nr:glycosyltransferase family 2 protein [Candidatus Eremiobacteraeota bacterium]MBC5802381.1 glycosyltransferase family 2 protein [Candidatus Eremiobacteraeota bacterium]MBC5820599.1 glycosyltransferase family 2 protein [Candidatus Eremiobacteraeota bacterium]
MSLISIVIPLYNEEGNVPELLRRLETVMEAVTQSGDDYEIVAVNDGSQDRTLGLLRAERVGRPRLVIVDLSRNFGHQIAATAGLDAARGDAVVLMDGDLQDPPELIEAFLAKWREGYDVVYATRKSRKGESPFKLLTARIFYRTIRRLTNVSIPVDTGDFRLMSRRVVDALAQTREKHRFLRGLVSWVGYNQIGIEYERDARTFGKTKYPFSKMLRFAIDGITSFSEIPLRFATYLGFMISAFAFLYVVVILVLKILGLNEPGYTSMMVAILFLGGVQLITIGIAGEYLGRIYDQVKSRPLYLLSSVERSAGPAEHGTLPRAERDIETALASTRRPTL